MADGGNPSLTPSAEPPVSIRRRRLRRTATSRRFSAAPRSTSRAPTFRPAWLSSSTISATGLTVKNGTIVADYEKFYQNVYAGNGALAGAVDPTGSTFNLAAYQHTTDRDNVFNQTDFVYKTITGSALIRSRSARSSVSRPASISAIPASLRMAPIPSSTIRSPRPFSDR